MHSNTPLVSFCVITYNSSKYILETLESIKNQIYSNIELIITDDCSSDNTVEICNNWLIENKSRFERTILLTTIKNTGVCGNVVRGEKECQGEYFKIIAGDDYLADSYTTKCVEVLKENPDCGFVFTNINYVTEEENNKIEKQDATLYRSGMMFKELFMLEFWPYTPSWIMSKKIATEFPVNESIWPEDYYRALRVAEKYPIIHIDEYLTYYRRHNNNTGIGSIKSFKGYVDAIDRFKYYPLYLERRKDLLKWLSIHAELENPLYLIKMMFMYQDIRYLKQLIFHKFDKFKKSIKKNEIYKTTKKKVKRQFFADIVLVFNGLGNQMSQYAFYLAKKENNSNVYCLYYPSDNIEQHNRFELNKIFNIKLDKGVKYFLIRKLYRAYLNKDKQDINGKVSRLILKYTSVNFLLENFSTHEFNASLLENNTGVTFYWGGWHCEKYFESIKEKLISTYHFSLEKNDVKNQQVLLDILNKTSVSIHVRRGDYMSKELENVFGNVCDMNYYNQAINYIKERIEYPFFFIFSDDKDWVKNNFNLSNSIVVDSNSGVDSWKDMYLISKCKHNINANSTFSWWGAWLNNNPEKIVVVPDKFGSNDKIQEVYPETWIKMPV